MKAIIASDGLLKIKRGRDYKWQGCPITKPENTKPEGYTSAFADRIICGDWCPLFGEPVESLTITNGGGFTTQILQLCHSKITGEIQDERK